MFVFQYSFQENTTVPVLESHNTQPLHVEQLLVPVTQQLYQTALATPRIDAPVPFTSLRGGVVPHHDVASDMIAGFFQTLALNKELHTIIVLGPNHTDIGAGYGITAEVAWNTPSGMVEQDNALLATLVTEGWATYDPEQYKLEHSVKVLTPYIAEYLPEVKIAPILLSSQYGKKEALAFADRLSLLMKDPGVALISSIDFSHYLSSSVSKERDKETLAAIDDRAYDLIWHMTSDHLDSPLSLIILLEAMDRIEHNTMHMLAHDELGGYMGSDVEVSTSYFSLVFGGT